MVLKELGIKDVILDFFFFLSEAILRSIGKKEKRKKTFIVNILVGFCKVSIG